MHGYRKDRRKRWGGSAVPEDSYRPPPDISAWLPLKTRVKPPHWLHDLWPTAVYHSALQTFSQRGAYHDFFHPPAGQGGLCMEFEFRSEIRDFIAASETILSPIRLVPPMTTEEKQLVQVYVTELA